MRRWIVVREQITGMPERLQTGLRDRMPAPVRLTLPGFPEAVATEARASLEIPSVGPVRIVVLASYSVPRGPGGARVDEGALRKAVEAAARELLRGLAADLEYAGTPLSGESPSVRARQAVVRDVMNIEVPLIDDTMHVGEAASLLAAAGVEAAPVVAAHGRLIGVLSERDLLGEAVRGHGEQAVGPSERQVTARDLCSRPAIVTVPELSLDKAARQMLFHGVRLLVVVEDGHLVGVVTRTAVFQALRLEGACDMPAERLEASAAVGPKVPPQAARMEVERDPWTGLSALTGASRARHAGLTTR